MSREKALFKQASTTFFNSSLFLPRGVRQDVFDLYSFVRVADDYVDQTPTNREGFNQLRRIWDAAAKSQTFHTDEKKDNEPLELRAVKNMLRVARKHNFDTTLVDSFLDTMQSDLDGKSYKTLDDTLKYVYGSAEVVGLMMAKVMNLKPEANHAAMMQGRAMQFINFIRDIEEDNRLGRIYFPAEDLNRFGLTNLNQETAAANPEAFSDFVRFQISRYESWQAEAADGYEFIPWRLRASVKTAVDMYSWTAKQISKDPLIVFKHKVKPSKLRVLSRFFLNII